ncbi:MAG: hypothetical protein HYZ51_02555 [Candidatus Doudnabacteria bacterium]|nr:hypothetical protein [Candidatus Doudnabacteria bacterium]
MSTITGRLESQNEGNDSYSYGYVLVEKTNLPSSEELVLKEEQRKAQRVADTLFYFTAGIGLAKVLPVLSLGSVVAYGLVATATQSQIREPLGRALYSLSKTTKVALFTNSNSEK